MLSKLAWWCTLAGVFLAPQTGIRPFEINLTYSDIALSLAFVLIVIAGIPREPLFERAAVRWLWIGGCALFLGGAVLSLYRVDPVSFVEVWAQYAFCFGVLPIVFWHAAARRQAPDLLIARVFVYGAACACAIGIIAYLLPSTTQFEEWALVRGNRRVGSVMGNPNYLAAFIALCIPIAVALRQRQNLGLGTSYVIWGLFVTALLLASSFGGLIAACAALTPIMIMRRRPISALVAIAPLVIGGVIVIQHAGLPEVFESRVLRNLWASDSSTASAFGSMSERAALADEAMALIAENPIVGLGLGSYASNVGQGATVHNTLLLAWIEAGILAPIGLLLLALIPFAQAMASSGRSRATLAVALGFVAAFFVNMQVLAHIYARVWFVPYFVMLLVLRHAAASAPFVSEAGQLLWRRAQSAQR